MFAFEAARISRQPAVFSDDAVARDDDAQRVSADSLSDLSGVGAADCRGDGPIRQRLAVGDGAQQVPDSLLVFVTVKSGGQFEPLPAARQVLRQLSLRVGKQCVGRCVDPRAHPILGGPIPVIPEIEAGECVVFGDERELAEGAFDDRMSGVHTLKTVRRIGV